MGTRKINLQIILAAVTFLCSLILLTGLGLAQESMSPSNTNTTVTPTTPTEDDNAKLNDRIQKRKTELKTKLTTAQQKRVQSKCKNAQGILKNNTTRANTVDKNRKNIHANMVERLTSLETKLAAKELDTTAFKAQITALEAKVETFNTDMTVYLQAVADTSQLDCAADPVAFKASLDASRTALQKVRTDAVDIRTHVINNVKPELLKLRTQLPVKETAQ